MKQVSVPKNEVPFLRVRRLCAMICASILASEAAAATNDSNESNEVEFEQAFIGGGADLRRFSRPNAVAPGIYPIELVLNGSPLGREDITFKATSDELTATPCLSRETLERLGVDFSKVAQDSQAADALPVDDCDVLSSIPHATASFDGAQQRLNIQVSQSYIARRPRGYVSPDAWDAGATTAFLGYRANAFRTEAGRNSSEYGFVSLSAGANLGRWQLRHVGSFSHSTEIGSSYTRLATFVQRDVTPLKARLTIGETFTEGSQFDSVKIRGATLASDERMMPFSQSGYAPVIRGTALSTTRVAIRQRGSIVYETTVAPGPFLIDDLFDTGFGGDLEVSLTDASGHTTSYTVPFAATANVVRQGAVRFAIAAGTVDAGSQRQADPKIIQGTVKYGLTSMLTGYGGVIASNEYAALQTGVGINSSWGAVSADITSARTQLHARESVKGNSFRVRYSKSFEGSGTSFGIAAFRFNTDGYFSLLDGIRARDTLERYGAFGGYQRMRNRLDLTLNQALGSQGSLVFTGSQANYRGSDNSVTTFSGGYSRSWRDATVNVSVQRSRRSAGFGQGTADTAFQLNVSVPLGVTQSARLTTQFAGSGDSRRTQMGFMGSAGADRQINYNASLGLGKQREVDLGAAYTSAIGIATANYAHSRHSRSTSFGLSGGVVAHPGGITLAQSTGETMAVVHAPGGEGARVSNVTGVRVDRRGYAVVPHLMAYRLNDVALDTLGTSGDVEFATTMQRIAPRFGAVVPLKFKTISGRQVTLQITQESGQSLPFGASVTNQAGDEVGIVGQGGLAYVRIDDLSLLNVSWGDAQACQISVVSAEIDDQSTARAIPALCRRTNIASVR